MLKLYASTTSSVSSGMGAGAGALLFAVMTMLARSPAMLMAAWCTGLGTKGTTLSPRCVSRPEQGPGHLCDGNQDSAYLQEVRAALARLVTNQRTYGLDQADHEGASRYELYIIVDCCASDILFSFCKESDTLVPVFR